MINGRVLAWSVLVGHLAGGNVIAQATKTLKASDYEGCYTVALSPWTPRFDGDVQYATPPGTIELTGVRVEGFKKTERFWVKPALGAKAGGLSMSFWHLTSQGQVEITFTTGFVGLTMRLVPKGSALVGTATTGGDVNPGENTQTTGARADRVACAIGK